jgi:hypothetical protein
MQSTQDNVKLNNKCVEYALQIESHVVADGDDHDRCKGAKFENVRNSLRDFLSTCL